MVGAATPAFVLCIDCEIVRGRAAAGKKSAMLPRACAASPCSLSCAACHPPQPQTPMTWPTLDDQLLADAAATFNFRLGHPTPLAITPRRRGAVPAHAAARRSPPICTSSTPDGAVTTLVDRRRAARRRRGAPVRRREGAPRAHADRDPRRRRHRRLRRRQDRDGPARRQALPDRSRDRQAHARSIRAARPTIRTCRPTARAVAFVRDGDLWIVDRAGGAPTPADARTPRASSTASPTSPRRRSSAARRGFWWSPDSKQLAFQRSDLRTIDTIYVADARHNDRPPVPFKYPRAGTPNAIVDLGIVDVRARGEPRWLDLGPRELRVPRRASQWDAARAADRARDRPRPDRAARCSRSTPRRRRQRSLDRARRRVAQRRRRRAALARRRLAAFCG